MHGRSAWAVLDSSANWDVRRTPLWLWPNLLSLDAPLIAVLWQGFLADQLHVPLPVAPRVVLGLTAWAIYLLDRIFDARKPESEHEPARHRYYREHLQLSRFLACAVLIADVVVAVVWLNPIILREGLIPLAAVALYLAACHITEPRILIPKEIAAALLFSGGTFIGFLARVPLQSLFWPATAFFALCLMNIVAIETWESHQLTKGDVFQPHSSTRWLVRNYSLWAPAAVLACAMIGRGEWYSSVALSASGCVVLFWTGNRISMDARRVLIDSVLLVPLFFIAIR